MQNQNFDVVEKKFLLACDWPYSVESRGRNRAGRHVGVRVDGVAAAVSLADANGRPRLVMRVEADGAAVIEFLDGDGKPVQRIPASK